MINDEVHDEQNQQLKNHSLKAALEVDDDDLASIQHGCNL
jgi:hypothetical protein